MSKEHPFILFVGEAETGQNLRVAAQARGWYVLLPQDDLEALAMYIVYYPDISVIDPCAAFADEVDFHLRSLGTALILPLGAENSRPSTPGTIIKALLDVLAIHFPAPQPE